MNNNNLTIETHETQFKQSIEATLVAKLNLANFQNAVPVLRELSVVHEAAEEVTALELRLESAPAFLKPKRWRIDVLRAGERCHITDLDVQLDGALLSRLTEAEHATVSLVLYRTGEVPEELVRLERPVELLPRNQWGGLSHLPDMIAAFVQPNEPAVERLLKQTAEVLRKYGKHSALNGYDGGSKRAWELTSGIWSAVAAMGLDYALPPASFEHTGQKIRGPGQIAESGLATCLDLALLFCAAIEQVGLNPLLVITKGHAFAGVWLKPEEFSTTVVDDITALRKRVKLKELVLFETTVVTHRPAPRSPMRHSSGHSKFPKKRKSPSSWPWTSAARACNASSRCPAPKRPLSLARLNRHRCSNPNSTRRQTYLVTTLSSSPTLQRSIRRTGWRAGSASCSTCRCATTY